MFKLDPIDTIRRARAMARLFRTWCNTLEASAESLDTLAEVIEAENQLGPPKSPDFGNLDN